jgi:hypothetical protein
MKLVMRWAIGGAALAGVTVHVGGQEPPAGQAGQAPQAEKCLHGELESAEDKARREEALAAMRMIAYVVDESTERYRSGPKWSDLKSTPTIRRLEVLDGPVGDLARKIEWGEPEPLPDWAMVWPIGPMARRPPLAPPAVFMLTDMRDPCLFRYSSTDPEVMQAARPSLKLLRPDSY